MEVGRISRKIKQDTGKINNYYYSQLKTRRKICDATLFSTSVFEQWNKKKINH
jgi:hypothetical protein